MKRAKLLWALLVLVGILSGIVVLRWPSCPTNCPGLWPWCCQFPGGGVPVREK